MAGEWGKLHSVSTEMRVEEQRDRFERLARELEPTLIRVATRMCGGNRDRAADCVQESILNAYRSYLRGGLVDPTGFRPWMLRILSHEVYAQTARDRRAVPSEHVSELIERSQPRDNETEQAVLSQVLSGDLELALLSLGDDQRMAVLLVDVEGVDYQEAADILGVPIGTVRSRLARARLHLNERLSNSRRNSSHV